MIKRFAFFSLIIFIVIVFYLKAKGKDDKDCQELIKKMAYAYDKLDKFCQQDSDCMLIGCGDAINKNSNATEHGNFVNEAVKDGCLPSIECQEFVPKCKNSICKAVLAKTGE